MFTSGEQEFHASKGFQNEPSRCQECRAARKAERGGELRAATAPVAVATAPAVVAGYGRQEREMFSATCSTCGQEARVPFQPRGDKPVYCSNCFTPRQSSGYGGGRGYR